MTPTEPQGAPQPAPDQEGGTGPDDGPQPSPTEQEEAESRQRALDEHRERVREGADYDENEVAEAGQDHEEGA